MKTRLTRIVSSLAIMAALLMVMVVAGCDRVSKPELKGEGPLALTLPEGMLSPEYHQPVEYWKTHHMDIIAHGDYEKQECMLCHDANTSCNNCHEYVGVATVETYE
ncbi:MAG: hypothetical protein HZA22_13610 [Nitrospirae bacterium]|nr:hypothetical protein [Nitrospirota bacterium]MBI5694569.1 hypothetical protein [Nitrospirota bacterium]